MKKIVSKLILLAAIVLTVVVLNPAKAHAADFAGGKGTKNSPYLVKTYEQLCKVNYTKYKGCYFKQVKDIDCANKKVSQLFGSSFTGKYDGNSKKISNIRVSGSNAYIAGDVASSGIVKNLTFYKPVVEGTYVASIFKNNYGIIKNVSVVKGKFITNFKYSGTYEIYSEAAGFVIDNKRSGVIEKCTLSDSKIMVTTDAWRGVAQVSGIASNNEGTIKKCVVKNATLQALSNQYTAKIAGICSWNNKGTVSSCKISVKTAKARGDKRGRYGAVEYGEVGRIVHYNEGTVKSCTVSKTGTWSGDKGVKNIYINKGKYIK